jgi:hypothetical protein
MSQVATAAANGDDDVLPEEEKRWLFRVRETLEQQSAEDLGAAARVFDVPRTLRDTKPEAYEPQHFALGPYHHQRRSELRDMERYKLAAAKRAERHFAGGRTIEHLVERLSELQDEMRTPYHRILDFRNKTLAWMMAIDTCFLLDFLEGYNRDEATDMVSSAANWINATVRDAMMIENQVPLRLFAEALELRRHASEPQQQVANPRAMTMCTVLDQFIKHVSPIKMRAGVTIDSEAHLLELLYHYLVPKGVVFDENTGGGKNPTGNQDRSLYDVEEQPIDAAPEPGVQPPQGDEKNTVKIACSQVSSRVNMGSLLGSGPMRSVSKLYGKMTSRLPALRGVVSVVGRLLRSVDVDGILSGMSTEGVAGGSAPLAKEIKIPSVEQLAKCGVRFLPTTEGIQGIHFDAAAATLRLPVITLDATTEVVLRNLVAYEAVAVRGPLVLARYTELMNGIIDTTRDVKILRQSHVLVNRMKSNREAADMWNGMCRAARVSKVSLLDNVIREVNDHRDRTPAVRLKKMLKRYVFGSWKILTLLASVALLVMTGLEAFCSAYPCHDSWFGNVLLLDSPDPSN